MDKLRLEWYKYQHEKMVINIRDTIGIGADDLGWLLEQCERAKELEKKLEVARLQFETIKKVETLEGAYFHAQFALEQIK